MSEQEQQGKEWIVKQFVLLSQGAEEDKKKFEWEDISDRSNTGAILRTDLKDHIFFSDEQIEDCAAGPEWQKLMLRWIPQRIETAKSAPAARREYAKCPVKADQKR